MNFNDQDTDHSLRIMFGGIFQTSHATLDDIITSDFDEFLTYNTLPFGSLSLSFNLEGALLWIDQITLKIGKWLGPSRGPGHSWFWSKNILYRVPVGTYAYSMVEKLNYHYQLFSVEVSKKENFNFLLSEYWMHCFVGNCTCGQSITPDASDKNSLPDVT